MQIRGHQSQTAIDMFSIFKIFINGILKNGINLRAVFLNNAKTGVYKHPVTVTKFGTSLLLASSMSLL